MTKDNIYVFNKTENSKEFFENIAFGSGNFRIEKILSLPYSNGEWYDQSEDELVLLLDGTSTIEFENGELIEMQKGDSVLIKKGLRHRVAKTSEQPHCVWLTIFSENISLEKFNL